MTLSVERDPGAGPIDEAVLSLLKEVFVGEGYTDPSAAEKAFTTESIRERGQLWIATADGAVAGTVILAEPGGRFRQIAEEGELEVHLLAVAPAFRRAGVGDALLHAIFEEAGTRAAKSLVLSTQPSMVAAQQLYRKLGFERAPQRDWTRADGRRFLAFVRAAATR